MIKDKVIDFLSSFYKLLLTFNIRKVLEIFLLGLFIFCFSVFLFNFNFKINKANIDNVKISLDKGPRGNYPKIESLFGVIDIPSIKVNVNLYKGSDDYLKYGAVHHSETYFPTDGKVILISASSHYFANIDKLKSGDVINLNTVFGSYKYKVLKTRVRTISKLKNEINSIDTESLILYTDLNESERLVVYAR